MSFIQNNEQSNIAKNTKPTSKNKTHKSESNKTQYELKTFITYRCGQIHQPLFLNLLTDPPMKRSLSHV